MTNAESPAERYFEEVRHRAAGFVQALRGTKTGGTQDAGNRLRVALANILPAQYGVVKGTVVSSSRKLKPLDIDGALIVDQAGNSPLFQGAGDLYPVETVLGAVARIRTLDSSRSEELHGALEPLRAMAKRGRFYLNYDLMTKPNGKQVAALREQRHETSPRTYVLVETMGWEKPGIAAKALKDALQRMDDGHLDGLLALDRDWFFYQADNKHHIEAETKDGTIRFVQKMMADLAMAEKFPMLLTRYAPD